MSSLLLALAAAAASTGSAGGSAGEVFVMETPGHTRFAYLPETIRIRSAAEGDVRSVTIITHNPDIGTHRPGDQIGARGTMEFLCARHAYREVTTTAIQRSGAEVVVVPPNPARAFAETRPGSFERKLAEAVCLVEL